MSAISADREWSPEEFRAHVETWFESHAPKKGGPDDFSSVHIVSAPTATASATVSETHWP